MATHSTGLKQPTTTDPADQPKRTSRDFITVLWQYGPDQAQRILYSTIAVTTVTHKFIQIFLSDRGAIRIVVKPHIFCFCPFSSVALCFSKFAHNCIPSFSALHNFKNDPDGLVSSLKEPFMFMMPLGGPLCKLDRLSSTGLHP